MTETATPRAFYWILANNAVANITNYTVWFALTFWVFLETRSVFATGMIAGLFLVLTSACAIWFGSLVDHHRNRTVMLGSSLASAAFYATALILLLLAPKGVFARVDGPMLWLLIGILMLGVIAGNIRSIALPTLVTALIPEDRRDKANGLVGMVTGIGFLTTSVISGLLVAWSGMTGTMIFALALTILVIVQLAGLHLQETVPVHDADGEPTRSKIDLRGTLRVIGAVPGLYALILFACFNNFLGGVYMALMDAYGLSLMPVQAWGLLWGGVSVAFILAGIIIARVGLGSRPLRTLLLVNLIMWTVASLFTIQPSIIMLGIGCFLWMFLGPWAEAAEQTTLQKVVPFERQGRVFGFAQSVEQAASPLTAFMIGPLAQFVVIPFMTDGHGARTIGGWFGTGPDRGIALVFTIAGVLGVLLTIAAFNSAPYRRLSDAYRKPAPDAGPPA